MKADCEDLQKDLMMLSNEAIKWQMKLNVDECQVMHMGKKTTATSHACPNLFLGCTSKILGCYENTVL